MVVPEEAWKLWWKWYAGGPPLPRKTIAAGWYNPTWVVEVRLFRLKFVRSSDKTKEFPLSFSKTSTVGELSNKLCKRFKLDPANVRIWDWHGRSKIKLLTKMSETLDEAQIIHNQLLLIEEKDANGKFPDDFRTPSTGYSSSYGWSSSYCSRYNEPSEPGICGLQNLGNTCFMNSALQCLSNTAPLTNFFLSDAYKNDINRSNPLGTRGQLVEAYSSLLKEMWAGTMRSTPPRSFKYKLEEFAPQFSGYQQHDAQELLAFLLDGIHEDLNRVKQKPYVEIKEADGRSDTEVAEEAWEGHLARNDSVIVDMFQGQLKSTLVCPECSQVSITFDPFMYLSLPLPMKMTRLMIVTFVSRDPSRRPIKYGIDAPKHGSIKELRRAIAETVSVKPSDLVLADLYNSRFFKKYSDRESLDSIQDRDVTVAFELSPLPAEEEPNEVAAKKEKETEDADAVWGDSYYRNSYVKPEPKDGPIQVQILHRKEEVPHHSYVGYSGTYTRKVLFGHPFVLRIPNKITYAEFYKQALRQLEGFLKGLPDPLPRPMETTESQVHENKEEKQGLSPGASNTNQYTSGSEHTTEDQSSSSEEDEYNSYSKRSVKPVAPPESIDGRPLLFHLKVVDSFGANEQHELFGGKHGEETLTLRNDQTIALCWTKKGLDLYDDDKENDIEVHPSARPGERDNDESVSLDGCLNLFTQAEQLGPEDPWYCNKCKAFRQATKKFDLWKMPRVLVVHLKRFSYKNKYWREKLDTLVDFPLEELDLSSHVIGPFTTPPPVYELYGISNHYGSLLGGHYTAYAKNHRDNKWYNFDDSSVSQVQPEAVKTSAAYLLFYRLKEDSEDWRGILVSEAATTSHSTVAPFSNASNSSNPVRSDSDNAESDHSGDNSEDREMQD